MEYEKCLKDELVKKCNEKDEIIYELRKNLERFVENEEINRSVILENVRIKQELQDVTYQLDMNCNTINNLREQLEVYKNCIKALSGNIEN